MKEQWVRLSLGVWLYIYVFLLLSGARIIRQDQWNYRLVTPRERSQSHQLNIKLPDSGSGLGPYPQGESLPGRGPPAKLLQSHGTKEDFSRQYLWALQFCEPHQGTFKIKPGADPPFKPTTTGQVISGIQLEAVAMGFFRCWLMSSLARDTWICS